MTVGPIAFDANFGSPMQFLVGESVVFSLPDDSGLAPLVLPDEFLRGQEQHVEPSSEAVRRFEAAMSAGLGFSPSAVKGLVACGIPEAPPAKCDHVAPVDSRRVAESQSQPIVVEHFAGPFDARQETRDVDVESPKVEGQRVESPTVERPPVAMVERPATVTVEKPVQVVPQVVSPVTSAIVPAATENPVNLVNPVEKETPLPTVSVNVSATVQAPAEPVDSRRVAESQSQPIIVEHFLEPFDARQETRDVTVENPKVEGRRAENPTVERPPVAVVERPATVTGEQPVQVVPQVVSPFTSAVVPAATENPVNLVNPVEQETPLPTVSANVSATVQAPSGQVGSRRVAESQSQPIIVEHFAGPFDARQETRDVTVESPKVEGRMAENPTVERPPVAVVERPATVTGEQPVQVVPQVVLPVTSAVAPAATENPVNLVNTVEKETTLPTVSTNVSATVQAPAEPVDSRRGAESQSQPIIVEYFVGPFDARQETRDVTVESPKVEGRMAENPTVERPPVAVVERPATVTGEQPVQVVPQVVSPFTSAVVLAATENPVNLVNPVEQETPLPTVSANVSATVQAPSGQVGSRRGAEAQSQPIIVEHFAGPFDARQETRDVTVESPKVEGRMAENPTVERPPVAVVERPATVTGEQPVQVVPQVVLPVTSAVAPAATENPVNLVNTVEKETTLPTVSVNVSATVQAPAEPVDSRRGAESQSQPIIVEYFVGPFDARQDMRDVKVESPKVEGQRVESPTVERPPVAMVERPATVTVEKPVQVVPQVVSPVTSAVVPAATENPVNLVNPVEKETPQPTVNVNVSATAQAPAEPVDSHRVAESQSQPISVEHFAGPFDARQDTRDVKVESPKVKGRMAENLTIERPPVAVVERSATVTVEQPVQVVPQVVLPVTSAVVPAAIENPVNPVNPVEKETPLPTVSVSVSATAQAPAEPVDSRRVAEPQSQPISVEHFAGPFDARQDTRDVKVESLKVEGRMAENLTIERPPVAVVERPVIETIEKPVQVVSPVMQAIAPAATENPVNLVNPVEKETPQPTVSANVSATVQASADSVDSSRVVEVQGLPSIGESSVVKHETKDVISEERISAKPIVIENPVGSVNKTPVKEDPLPIVATTVERPVVVIAEKPVQVVLPATPAITPAVTDNHVNSVEKTAAPKVVVEKPEEKAVAASAHVIAPVVAEVSVPQTMQAAPEVAAASAASARTEAIVETVNQIVEAVVGKILVTPGIMHGDCDVKIMLKPTVLDGSEITMSSKDGTLTVCVTPATPEASATAAAALPRLETALAEHAPAFRQVSVALAMKKGSRNETV